MSEQSIAKIDRFISFQTSVDSFDLPERFTYPFYYTPNPLVKLAAEELQAYLMQRTDWEHNFGVLPNKNDDGHGKMFGVLVVEKTDGALGYLAAFSGKLDGENDVSHFVPPVHNMPEKDGFIDFGMVELGEIGKQIAAIEQQPEYLECKQILDEATKLAQAEIETKRQENITARSERKQQREEGKNTLTAEEFAALDARLSKESVRRKSEFKTMRANWDAKVLELQKAFDVYAQQVDELKAFRSKRSFELQQQLFDQYDILNKDGELKNVVEIFKDAPHQVPPAAAGDCAAPKLLQYAFEHQLRPVAIGEFWWGQSPSSELRKHGVFYPACRGKCEPILGHMLKGIVMDENPLLNNMPIGGDIEIVHEDDAIIIINKPFGLLSVPGKTLKDSVFSRMSKHYPESTKSLIIHRLDMATSGLMILAKTQEAHRFIHRQFEGRTVKKRYAALLDGIVDGDEGLIDLPLRVDLDDRPRQLVCEEHGKPAQTKWKVISRSDGCTKVHFFPITGRSHQLRVHSAHPRGLNLSIVGDALYGTRSNRLHLHAEAIEFTHPTTRERVEFEVLAGF